MNCKFWFQTAVALLLTTTATAQESAFESTNFDSAVRPSAYITTLPFVDDDEEKSEEISERLARLDLRLRELENDLADRLEAYEEQADEAADSDDDVYDRLDELEDAIKAQDKSIGKFNDTLPGLVYHSHKNPKLQFFGRIHLDYWAFPRTDDVIFPLEANGANPDGNPEDRVAFRRL